MKRIAIFGGTFNPVQIGHLIGAQIVCERLQLDQVIFMPCFLPPHKTQDNLAAGAERLKMLRLAVAGNKKFVVSDFEIKRAGKSYSIDTARFLRRKFPSKTQIFFIIGEDNYAHLSAWKNIDELRGLVNFVVLNRSVGTKFVKRVSKSKNTVFVQMPQIDISSSLIRHNLRQRKSVRYLLSEKVLTFINKRKLYY